LRDFATWVERPKRGDGLAGLIELGAETGAFLAESLDSFGEVGQAAILAGE